MIYELDEIALKIGEIFAPFGEEAADSCLEAAAIRRQKAAARPPQSSYAWAFR